MTGLKIPISPTQSPLQNKFIGNEGMLLLWLKFALSPHLPINYGSDDAYLPYLFLSPSSLCVLCSGFVCEQGGGACSVISVGRREVFYMFK
jgi:hypothetical protein